MDNPLRLTPIHYHRKLNMWLVALVIVLISAFLLHRCSQNTKTPARPALPVVLAAAQTRVVPVYLVALGAVTPTYSVTVRTQINGQLLRVLFTEGQMVKKGDLLAEIDPRVYEAQLIQYEGQLTRDRALLANARLDLKRYQKLWHEDSISKQTLDTQVALVQQDEGTVKLDEGLFYGTQVNLIYTRITSPIDGRVGLRLVDPGNFVQTSDTTGIAVINMLNPITVIFTLPEDNIPVVLKQMNTGKKLTVLAYDRQDETLLDHGTLLTMDNQVDPTTGTVKLRALFPNTQNRLFPSQFVNIHLLVDTLPHATTIPTAAVQQGANGLFVYLLENDNTVKVTPITTSLTTGNDTVVLQGVLPQQFVVVEGADKLTNGAKVSVAHSPLPKRQTA